MTYTDSGKAQQPDDMVERFLGACTQVLERVERKDIAQLAHGLSTVRDRGGRLFILGVGGSAGHASHAVNDFRKLCAFEAYSPTDNASELTARINDEGWETCFSEWLKGCRVTSRDAVLVFSVGGGSAERRVSVNLVNALDVARGVGAKIFGIVGRDGGYTKQVADACVLVPEVEPNWITPLTEGFCAVFWHLLVSHPLLQRKSTKWEGINKAATAPAASPSPL